jgi:hypothetical protein
MAKFARRSAGNRRRRRSANEGVAKKRRNGSVEKSRNAWSARNASGDEKRRSTELGSAVFRNSLLSLTELQIIFMDERISLGYMGNDNMIF